MEYNRDTGIVTATGHVEAWQNDQSSAPSKITSIATPTSPPRPGTSSCSSPDGQVLFSDYAELSEGMRNGVLRGMRAVLAENGKLAANGARRFEGKLNELSHVVYSTCNLCKENPDRPPLVAAAARSRPCRIGAQADQIYRCEMEMRGIPVACFPYSPTPILGEAPSGLLIPSIGTSSHIGQFVSIPYYGVLNDQSDVTITPMLTTQAGPKLALSYRRRFNDG